jgi:hypothetical protein
MGGMITSLTNELTIVANAAPMMMPTAMSRTLPRMANSLNSFSMMALLRGGAGALRTQLVPQSRVASVGARPAERP